MKRPNWRAVARRLAFDSYPFPAEPEPDGDVFAPHHFYVGVVVAVFGFMFVWPYYPSFGAVLVVLGWLITLDDILSHALGVWTPLDFLWGEFARRNRWIRRPLGENDEKD